MAYSFIQYPGNGVTTLFSIPFPFIQRSHVSALVNGVATTAFTWITDSQIQFSVAPAGGTTVELRRTTSPTARIVDFSDAARLTETTLDTDSLQAFYMTQEAIDAASKVQAAVDAAVITGAGYLPTATSITVTPTGTVSSTNVQAAIAEIDGDLNSMPLGQCRLTKSGANLVLVPYQGNRLTINGALRTIPAVGVSLAPTALSVGTNYYIYAYWDGSAIQLLASATTHATHTDGTEIMSGDATRALVGFARIVTGPAWADTLQLRLVLSWHNRLPIYGRRSASGGTIAASSTSWAELSSALRIEFLCWANGRMRSRVRTSATHTTGGGNGVYVAVGLATPGQGTSPGWMQVSNAEAGSYRQLTAENNGYLGEGYAYVTAHALVTAGTANFEGSAGYTDVDVEVMG
jgi:hypothetical protein